MYAYNIQNILFTLILQKKKVNGYFYNFYIYITLYCITRLGLVSCLRWPPKKAFGKNIISYSENG